MIVFRLPFGAPDLAIKRAVALPGDCMPQRRGLSVMTPTDGRCNPVPADSVFVVGDNVDASLDSRDFGPVPDREIVGKVVLVLPVTQWLADWRAAIGP